MQCWVVGSNTKWWEVMVGGGVWCQVEGCNVMPGGGKWFWAVGYGARWCVMVPGSGKQCQAVEYGAR